MTMQTYTLKRGATLSLAGTASLPSGTWTAAASAKGPTMDAVETLTVTLTPPQSPSTDHTILIVATGVQTADWPIETVLIDVKFTDASNPAVVLTSPTFGVVVRQSVT